MVGCEKSFSGWCCVPLKRNSLIMVWKITWQKIMLLLALSWVSFSSVLCLLHHFLANCCVRTSVFNDLIKTWITFLLEILLKNHKIQNVNSLMKCYIYDSKAYADRAISVCCCEYVCWWKGKTESFITKLCASGHRKYHLEAGHIYRKVSSREHAPRYP